VLTLYTEQKYRLTDPLKPIQQDFVPLSYCITLSVSFESDLQIS